VAFIKRLKSDRYLVFCLKNMRVDFSCRFLKLLLMLNVYYECRVCKTVVTNIVLFGL
jgi:hypothetical protein